VVRNALYAQKAENKLRQGGLAFSFPRARNSFPLGPKSPENPPGTVFENPANFIYINNFNYTYSQIDYHSICLNTNFIKLCMKYYREIYYFKVVPATDCI
jgi:hypothetical protein